MNKVLYSFLSITNILSVLIYFEFKHIYLLLFITASFVLNQIMLYVAVLDILKIRKSQLIIPSWLLLGLKLLLLMMAFYIAVSKLKESSIILVISYIFQLIILIISTKRVITKN